MAVLFFYYEKDGEESGDMMREDEREEFKRGPFKKLLRRIA